MLLDAQIHDRLNGGAEERHIEAKHLSVCALTCRTCSRTWSTGALPAPIMPRPPASQTATTSSHVDTQAMPPCRMG